jgi:Cu(I)/Ag(I) efflux system membrane protein CusA/SilA
VSAETSLNPINLLIRFCLEKKLVVGLLLFVFVGWGVMVAPFEWDIPGVPRDPVPVDAIPDIGENQQIVFTEWMGRSPQDVDDQITYPLTVALLGVPGVKTVRSYSFFGFSSIYIIFKEDVDFYWSRSRVLEKLSSLPAGTLPTGVQPALGPDATALGQVFWYTLEGRDPEGNPTGGWSLSELRTIQDWIVRYALLSAEGISEVASVGGYVKEYQVDVDPDAMRAHGVTLGEVFHAVRHSNLDVGARTIEVNSAEYVVRGLGFIERLEDLEEVVVRTNQNVPIRVRDVARVTLGPALRRGALDKEGAEVTGGVAVVRYGENPLKAIKHLKARIEEISPGLPRKVLIDSKTPREEVEAFAIEQGFLAYESPGLDQEAWVSWALKHPDKHPKWLTLSQVTVVPFYDRTGLIRETLGTLNDALSEEILITVIVILVMVLHLRSSILITGLIPLAVLICFIAMKLAGVDANVVALSGIAIAIGTMADMGIILCENILKHVEERPEDDLKEVVYEASCEVGSALVAAVATTVCSFTPVFAMEAAEGKLFRPLAFTYMFALIGSTVVAIAIIPPAAHILFSRGHSWQRWVLPGALAALGVAAFSYSFLAGIVILLLAVQEGLQGRLPERIERWLPYTANGLAVFLVAWILNHHWLPLGADKGELKNFLFTGGMLTVLLGSFLVFMRVYPWLLRKCLAHKKVFLPIPCLIVTFGLYVWLGPATVFGPLEEASRGAFPSQEAIDHLEDEKLIEERSGVLRWTPLALRTKREKLQETLARLEIPAEPVLDDWDSVKAYWDLRGKKWGAPDHIGDRSLVTIVRWNIARDWNGLGKEFMPPLDEGSYLYMPTTMPHASIGEALDVLQKLDMAMASVPEVDQVVGKLGRAETSLDPAPISMVETVVNYKPEYVTDAQGRRITFAWSEERGFHRDEQGELLPDPDGRPFRQWREHIRTAKDIWDELVEAAQLPGTTSAPRLQPIAARIVMLQSGMRAPMGVKIKGPDLETIETVCLDIERLLKQVPTVKAEAVVADRIVGKPYLEIDIDRRAIARHGLKITQVQDVIEVAVGGRPLTTTVEGRERYPVRVRYARELRDSVQALGRIVIPTPSGEQIPLVQLAEIRYVRGPQVIKSEDTFLTGYVLFDMKHGEAEVDVVEDAAAFLEAKRKSGELRIPAGVSYSFAGNYENQVRSEARLRIILPLALFIMVVILYFQFDSVLTTMIVFSGVVVAWAGGFLMLWLYGQPWFLDVTIFGENMRELFAVHPINLSVAVWVGFIALYGIADDDGVMMATYLDQSFERSPTSTVDQIREATVAGGQRRIRPCLMTTATMALALIPVLMSTGRGSDIMVPMAIPSFGGMCIALITLFVVPTLYCGLAEFRLWRRPPPPPEPEGSSEAQPTPPEGEPEALPTEATAPTEGLAEPTSQEAQEDGEGTT